MAEDRPTDDRPDERAGPAPAPDGRPAETDDTRTTGLPPRVERWRRRSAAGAIMTGFALGLQQVFEPEKKEPSIMLETSGDPPGDLPVDAELDGLGARHSVVRIRPWLLDRDGDKDPGASGGRQGGPGGEAADAGRRAGGTDSADEHDDRGAPGSSDGSGA